MPELEKAYLLTEDNKKLTCLFNPESMSVTRGNNWGSQGAQGRGKGVPRAEFNGATAATMNMTLIFDTTDDGSSVSKYTGPLMGLLDPNPNLSGTDEKTNNVRPPTVTFHWGELHSFPAVVTQLQLTFTYFAASGTPLRANAVLSLMQYEESNAFGPQNPTSGTPEPHRVHRVQPGETLDRIAARYYGDSTRWRELAGINGIEDPLAVRPGALLSVPRRTYT